MKNAFLKLKNAFKETIQNDSSLKGQLPNILTCSRAIAPFIIIPLTLMGNLGGALVAGAALASTDFFDGLLARKLNAQSEFGRIMDPIVDKIFAITLLAAAAVINPILIFNIIPEIGIGVVNYKAFSQNKKVSSSKLGKIKTWILSINILLSFIPSLSIIYKIIACYFTFAFQNITLNDYVKSTKLLETIPEEEPVKLDTKTIESQKKKEKKIKPKTKAQMRRMQKLELLNQEKELLNSNREKGQVKIIKKPKK